MAIRRVGNITIRTERGQVSAEAPDGYHFDEGPHVLIEPTGRGTSVASARVNLAVRVRLASLEKCSADCACGLGEDLIHTHRRGRNAGKVHATGRTREETRMAKGERGDDLTGRTVITKGHFGAVERGTARDSGKFAIEVPSGTEGTVTGPHPSPNLPGWWLVDVVLGGKHYDMPLTHHQVEVQSISSETASRASRR